MIIKTIIDFQTNLILPVVIRSIYFLLAFSSFSLICCSTNLSLVFSSSSCSSSVSCSPSFSFFTFLY